MAEAFIEVNHVCKSFKVKKREQGILNSIKSMVHQAVEVKKAVNDIDFEIQEGEMVGFLGPNGSGKSTTVLQKNYHH